MRVMVVIILIFNILLVLLAYLNGLGCRYKMTIPSSKSYPYDVISVCQDGHFTTVMSQKDIDPESIWLANGLQFNLFNHVFFYILEREKFNETISDKKFDIEQLLSQNENIYSYYYKIKDDKLVLANEGRVGGHVEIAYLEGEFSYW